MMSLRLYNTRTRRVEPFEPLRADEVGIYVCGLTPSAEAHLGHARSFLFFDVLRRYLVHLGYRVRYVRNVTDIDDRSIAAGEREGVPWSVIVDRYFRSFARSMDRLHLLEPDFEPRATAYVGEIIAMIEALVASGHAYAVRDGVYFSVRSFPRYGALSGRDVDELLIGARIAEGEAKRDPLDFALWKFAKAGEPAWPAPWGEGRPGWHIECSAMSRALLGEPFDIHGGGYDLIFPHHENEVAQSESLLPPDRPLANFWLHGGLLQFDGKKMSKSLGNFEPLSALLDRHDPQAIRLLFLQTGYRKPMNFTEASIAGAAVSLRRLYSAYDALRHAPVRALTAAGAARQPGLGGAPPDPLVAAERARFYAALDDDMNTASAVSVLFDLAGASRRITAEGDPAAAAGFIHEALEVLGLSPAQRAPQSGGRVATTRSLGGASSEHTVSAQSDPARLPPDTLARLRAAHPEIVAEAGDDAVAAVTALVLRRVAMKAGRDFTGADALRTELAALGVTIRDGKEVTTWTAGG